MNSEVHEPDKFCGLYTKQLKKGSSIKYVPIFPRFSYEGLTTLGNTRAGYVGSGGK